MSTTINNKAIYRIPIFLGKYKDEIDNKSSSNDTPQVKSAKKSRPAKGANQSKKEPALLSPKIKKEPAQKRLKIKDEPKTPIRKQSFYDCFPENESPEIMTDEPNEPDLEEKDIDDGDVPDLPSLDALLSTAIDTPAGRTRRKQSQVEDD
jgi:hypothetical protein